MEKITHYEKTLTSEVLFEGRVITLTKDTALLENGKTATREVVHHHGGACILPYFEDGTAEGNVMIVNEAINNSPQQVEFIRNDTGEQIFQSKAIPVGSKIERAALDVELPAGTYECTAMFHNLDPETGEIIGTAGAIITITIKN